MRDLGEGVAAALRADVDELRDEQKGGGHEAGRRLGLALAKLAEQQHADRQWEEALASAQEAVSILRRLARWRSEVAPDLVTALVAQFSVQMTFASQRRDAARAVGEAARVARRLTKRHPSLEPLLVETLLLQASAANLRQQPHSAVRYARQALAVSRRLTARDAFGFAPVQVRVLSALAQSLRDTGGSHIGEAVDHAQAAAAAARMLVDRGEESARPLLVATLTQTTAALQEAGRLDAASGTGAEALTLARTLVAEDAPGADAQLFETLSVQADVVRRLQRYEEAAVLQREVVQRLGTRLASDPGEWAEPALRGTTQLQLDLDALGKTLDETRAELDSLIDPQLVALALRRAAAGATSPRRPGLTGASVPNAKSVG